MEALDEYDAVCRASLGIAGKKCIAIDSGYVMDRPYRFCFAHLLRCAAAIAARPAALIVCFLAGFLPGQFD